MKPLAFLLALILAVAASPAAAQAPAPTAAAAAFDPVTADPPRDAAFPARNRQLLIPSGPVRSELGRPAEMNALFLFAAGEGAKPTMLLLHGLPGNERNLDLAQAVRRAGWNVLTFTYRGAWGSEGTFSIQHAIADAAAALAFLRSDAASRDFAVDRSRIVVAGHSMGGYIAAHVAANDAGGLAGLVTLDAWNIAASAAELKSGGASARAAFVAGFDDIGHALGPIDAADIADTLVRRGAEWSLPTLTPRLRLPVLAVWASRGLADENRAFAAALRTAHGDSLSPVEIESDHSFADSRIALARTLVAWLAEREAR